MPSGAEAFLVGGRAAGPFTATAAPDVPSCREHTVSRHALCTGNDAATAAVRGTLLLPRTPCVSELHRTSGQSGLCQRDFMLYRSCDDSSLHRAGLVAKRMKPPQRSPDLGAVPDRDCVYEVVWSADSMAATEQMPADGEVTHEVAAAAFRVQPSQAARGISAVLAVLQRSRSTGVREVSVTEYTADTARFSTGRGSALAALLRCAARELPGVISSSASQLRSTFGSGSGGAHISLHRTTAAREVGNAHGRNVGEAVVWRARLAHSTTCRVAGKSHLPGLMACVLTVACAGEGLWHQLCRPCCPLCPCTTNLLRLELVHYQDLCVVTPARAVTGHVLQHAAGDWRLTAEPPGALANLRRAPLHPPPSLRGGEVRLAVSAVGLNFRDVLNVLGMYPGHPGPPGAQNAFYYGLQPAPLAPLALHRCKRISQAEIMQNLNVRIASHDTRHAD